eukprot:3936432-Amphidinium_carterae.3
MWLSLHNLNLIGRAPASLWCYSKQYPSLNHNPIDIDTTCSLRVSTLISRRAVCKFTPTKSYRAISSIKVYGNQFEVGCVARAQLST